VYLLTKSASFPSRDGQAPVLLAILVTVLDVSWSPCPGVRLKSQASRGLFMKRIRKSQDKAYLPRYCVAVLLWLDPNNSRADTFHAERWCKRERNRPSMKRRAELSLVRAGDLPCASRCWGACPVTRYLGRQAARTGALRSSGLERLFNVLRLLGSRSRVLTSGPGTHPPGRVRALHRQQPFFIEADRGLNVIFPHFRLEDSIIASQRLQVGTFTQPVTLRFLGL
jgi:hypothetical protein